MLFVGNWTANPAVFLKIYHRWNRGGINSGKYHHKNRWQGQPTFLLKKTRERKSIFTALNLSKNWRINQLPHSLFLWPYFIQLPSTATKPFTFLLRLVWLADRVVSKRKSIKALPQMKRMPLLQAQLAFWLLSLTPGTGTQYLRSFHLVIFRLGSPSPFSFLYPVTDGVAQSRPLRVMVWYDSIRRPLWSPLETFSLVFGNLCSGEKDFRCNEDSDSSGKHSKEAMIAK